MSNSFDPWTVFSLWNSPGQNIGVGNHFFFQGIFLSQGSNPGLWHWEAQEYCTVLWQILLLFFFAADSLPTEPPGKPCLTVRDRIFILFYFLKNLLSTILLIFFFYSFVEIQLTTSCEFKMNKAYKVLICYIYIGSNDYHR